MAQNGTTNNTSKLAEFIKDINIGMLTTMTSDGMHRSRPMGTQIDEDEFDGTLYFFTTDDSEKVEDIKANSEVSISYQDNGKSTYISISGEAEVLKDRSIVDKFWEPIMKAWFPEGKDDPKLCVIKVEITNAEYWDNPSNKVVQILGFVKSAITGKPEKMGENKEVKV